MIEGTGGRKLIRVNVSGTEDGGGGAGLFVFITAVCGRLTDDHSSALSFFFLLRVTKIITFRGEIFTDRTAWLYGAG